MVKGRIPRRASRRLSFWQQLKRWWRRFWYRGTIIRFDEAPAKGVRITFDYAEEQEWQRIVRKPSVREALRHKAQEEVIDE